jgi:inhibitor of KinA sporulation pathway (predicted exonuclease)
MGQRDDRLVNVIDVEATCWNRTDPKPVDAEQEIIEIGITTLHVDTLSVSPAESLLVVPTRSRVGTFCTGLTTITQELVETAGISFEAAVGALKKRYHSRHRTWLSWGDFDRKLFDRQCRARGVPYPFGPRHINLKTLVTILCGLQRELTVTEAAAQAPHLLGARVPFIGTEHRGVDDAYNIARLAAATVSAFRRRTAAADLPDGDRAIRPDRAER